MNLCSFFPLFESVIYRFSDVFYFYLMIWWLVLVHNSAQIYPPLGVVSSHSCPKVWVFKHPRDNELKCFRYDSRIILFKFSVLAWQRMMEKRFLVWARWERFSDMFYDSWWEEKYVALRNASSGKLETIFFSKLRILKVNTKKMKRIARLWRRQEWQWWHHTPYLCKKSWLGDLGHEQIFDLSAIFLSFSHVFCWFGPIFMKTPGTWLFLALIP